MSTKSKPKPKKVVPDSTALNLGLRGAAADSIDPLEYVRWAK